MAVVIRGKGVRGCEMYTTRLSSLPKSGALST
jgi:hypothetical protein